MTTPIQHLNPSEAARRLGVSVKALRLYEERGLITPIRTEAGWRTYSREDMARAGVIVALRELGLSLGEVAQVLVGDAMSLDAALEAHRTRLDGEISRLESTIGKIDQLRSALDSGDTSVTSELVRLAKPALVPVASFDLPWPWGGERFELTDVCALNYIIGSLGSGKTRLARRLAEELPDAGFLGLDRIENSADAKQDLKRNPTLSTRVERALAWIENDGGEVSDALIVLLAALEADAPAVWVVDLIEHGLCEPTQEALISYLRCRRADARPIVMITRSSAILDLESVGADEAILLCPPNHSPPRRVMPYAGSTGYEAVAMCLAPPAVRARTEGVIAVRSQA